MIIYYYKQLTNVCESRCMLGNCQILSRLDEKKGGTWYEEKIWCITHGSGNGSSTRT